MWSARCVWDVWSARSVRDVWSVEYEECMEYVGVLDVWSVEYEECEKRGVCGGV